MKNSIIACIIRKIVRFSTEVFLIVYRRKTDWFSINVLIHKIKLNIFIQKIKQTIGKR